MVIFLISILFMMMLGVPIAITIGLSSASYIIINNIPVNIITQQLLAGINSSALLAIPLFILSGDIMAQGELAKRLINLANSLVGNIRGGLAIVVVLGCMFFGAISGSAVATAAAMGSILLSSLIRQGYDEGYAGALIASSSPLGVIIPPSISMIIYGSMTGTSVSQLYKAGVLAGILTGGVLIVIAYFSNIKMAYKMNDYKFSIMNVLKELKRSIFALGAPIIILGGIFRGYFTPTEAAVVAVFYSLIVEMFIYKDLNFDDIKKIILSSAKTTSNIMFIMSAATLFAWVLTFEQIPQRLAALMLNVSSNPSIIILMINLLIIFLGCFIDSSSILIIGVPLFMPVISQIGMNPVHFGIIITIATAIGVITPPFGVCLFTTSSVGNIRIDKLIKNIWLPLLGLVLSLMIISYFPRILFL